MFIFLKAILKGLFEPSTPSIKYYPKHRLNPKNFDNIKMRKITRPGVEINKVTLIEERIEKDSPEPPTRDLREIIKKKKERSKFQTDESRRLEVRIGMEGEEPPMREGTLFKYYLDSANGRYTNNGCVVYFVSKNAAKRTRKMINKKLNREAYWIDHLTDEQISRTLALPI